ncbi:MAG: alpha-amylase family glycosyl hydrolase [Oligoflexus sp.]
MIIRKQFGLIVLALCMSFTSFLLAVDKSKDFRNRPIEDDVFYFIMVDRFANGDPKNDKGFDQRRFDQKDSHRDIMRHGYWPENEGFYHGGDFKGITQNLDYLDDLGITALWLSPIMKNQPVQGMGQLEQHSSGYHGYWITDFTTVDPHFGTEEEFKELVDEAHKRGIKVFMDVITNHTADINSYRECDDCPYRSREDYPYSRERKGKQLNPGFQDGDFSEENFAKLADPNYAYTPYVRSNPGAIKKPEWLNELIYYHNRGNTTFSGESSEKGDFFGLDDLFTEHPRVVSGMIEIYQDWIRKYKIDGFRVDTVKHVNIEFWQEFVPAIRDFAKTQGIPNFFIFGEVFTGDPEQLSYYTREGQMDSVLDFAFHGAAKTAFADGGAAQAFSNTFASDDIYRSSTSPQKMMTFISNHDIGRIGHFIELAHPQASEEEKLQRSILAHAKMTFARGVPVIYYGDEQGFTGHGGDKLARQNMFPSRVAKYNDNNLLGTDKTTADDNFDKKHPLYLALQQFHKIYADHELLRRGEQYPCMDLQAEHAYAFLRTMPNAKEDFLVAFNWGNKAVSIPWQRSNAEVIYPEKGSIKKNPFELAPFSFAILKGQKNKVSLATRQATSIVSPAEGERVGDLFIFEVDAPSANYPVVDFAYQIKGDKAIYPLPRDYNPPYRAYIDGDLIPQGKELTLIAEITTPGQKTPVRLERDVFVDSREPLVRVHYENGNQRDHALHLTSHGETSIFQQLGKDGIYEFNWGKAVRQVFLVYGNGSSDKANLGAFDKPFVIDYDSLLSAMQNKDGQLLADLYVNNQHKLSTQPQPKSSTKPLTLASAAKEGKAAAAQVKTLYLRGGMNTWQTSDALQPKAPFTYSTTVKLDAGKVEFKVADENWSANSNFGAPIVPSGLTSSPQSGNLSLSIPYGKDGKYRFDFIYIPKEALNSQQALSFLKIEAM